MSRTKKVPLVRAAVVLLIIATLFGCSQLLRDGLGESGESGWYIKLNINHPAAAKAITVTEYDVTGLAIEVYDPDGVLIEEISWQADEGQQSYLIPVSEQGQHEIVVTHISDENGELVEAEESATFNIQAMVITVIDIIPGCIGVIGVDPGYEVGLTAEEIHEGAMAAMTALYEASAARHIGGEYPAGLTVDDTNFNSEEGGGTMIMTFSNYTLPESDVTVNGEITSFMTVPLDLDGTMEMESSGSLNLTGLPVETVTIDINLTAAIYDAPIWGTATWSGTITVDGHEADLDQVMTEHVAMLQDLGL